MILLLILALTILSLSSKAGDGKKFPPKQEKNAEFGTVGKCALHLIILRLEDPTGICDDKPRLKIEPLGK